MSALEKPTTPQPEIGQIPAESAGIFLSRTFELGPGAQPPITELVPKIQALEREGRLLSQRALPGLIIIDALPDAAGSF